MPPGSHDYNNVLHGFKQTELGNTKDLPARTFVVRDQAGNNPVETAREVKAIEIAFPDAMAREMTICVTDESVRREIGGNLQNTNAGPVVGIVEWGTGGHFSRIEFNVPPAFLWKQNGGIGAPVQGQNGVNLTVHGSSFRVLGRNDARLPPVNDADANIGNDRDAVFGAFISQNVIAKPCSPLQRAIIVVSGNGNSLAPAGGVSFGIPRYAKRVRFPRRPLTEPINVTLNSEVSPGSFYTTAIGAGSEGQIEIAPIFNTVTVQNNGAANISALTAVFDLEL